LATTEVLVNGTAPSFLDSGVVGQMLWRALDASDENYTQETTCFEFRYRKNKAVTTADETETVCAERAVPDETMDFTPFGSGGS